MRGLTVRHSGKQFSWVPSYNVVVTKQGIVAVRDGRQAGVVIIHPCGTRQWIGNSWYNDLDV